MGPVTKKTYLASHCLYWKWENGKTNTQKKMWWKEKYFGSFCTSIFFFFNYFGFDSAAKLPNPSSAEICVRHAGQLWSCQGSWPTQELQLRLGAAACIRSAGLGVPFGLSKPPIQCLGEGKLEVCAGLLQSWLPGSLCCKSGWVGCKANSSCRR